MSNNWDLLEVQELKTYFYTFDGIARAVEGVSFGLNKGETLGIVGESGSGKSVTALSVMRLIPEPPGKIVHGRILLNGNDILQISMNDMKDIMGNRISMIFQEPMTSLNPLFTVGDQISEMFVRHMNLSKKESWNQSVEMLEKVQIPSPGKRARDYPHQLSGGMRQRVMIAIALSCDPEILIADEPTTALDVTIQAQVLDLMLQLKEDFGASILMITHDLAVIAEIAQRVIVMYAGRVVEEGDVFTIFENPMHPYTRALLKSIPKFGNRSKSGREPLHVIKGIVPSLYNLPAGCSFYPRCPEAMDICKTDPIKIAALEENHRVRCALYPGH
ncbi:MAG: ABC transporter ATP-binding protein [Desulfobacteraceae bacterium]|nr:ABC transporter ATP-binding protein [Desulfobacteraceae bacterium]